MGELRAASELVEDGADLKDQHVAPQAGHEPAYYLRYHQRTRDHGVNRPVYYLTRAVLQPAMQIYFRVRRHGKRYVPKRGAVIFAANHRSFLDPFVIGLLSRRPCYYVAKKELFRNRLQGWFLNSLGAFPVDRGHSDEEMLQTARAVLARGDCLVIFPEGTRVRPGPLGIAKRGVGRLALETETAVVPVAVIGTEYVRRGLRVRPKKVKLRAGRALTFPTVERPTQRLAQAVTDRIWPCVEIQWEWLGGERGSRAVERAAVPAVTPDRDALGSR